MVNRLHDGVLSVGDGLVFALDLDLVLEDFFVFFLEEALEALDEELEWSSAKDCSSSRLEQMMDMTFAVVFFFFFGSNTPFSSFFALQTAKFGMVSSFLTEFFSAAFFL